MTTAKRLGFAKGDLVWTGSFPGVLVSMVHTATPVYEVFGIEQEVGSCYASDLRRLDGAEFLKALAERGYGLPLKVWSNEAFRALNAAGIQAVKQ